MTALVAAFGFIGRFAGNWGGSPKAFSQRSGGWNHFLYGFDSPCPAGSPYNFWKESIF